MGWIGAGQCPRPRGPRRSDPRRERKDGTGPRRSDPRRERHMPSGHGQVPSGTSRTGPVTAVLGSTRAVTSQATGIPALGVAPTTSRGEEGMTGRPAQVATLTGGETGGLGILVNPGTMTSFGSNAADLRLRCRPETCESSGDPDPNSANSPLASQYTPLPSGHLTYRPGTLRDLLAQAALRKGIRERCP